MKKSVSISFSVFILFSFNVMAVDLSSIAITPSVMSSNATIKSLPQVGEFDSRLYGYGISVSYGLTDWVGFEVRYSSREDLDFFLDEDGDFDVTSTDVFLYLEHDVTPMLFLRTRLGLSYWEAEGFSKNLNLFDGAVGPEDYVIRFLAPWEFSEFDQSTRFSSSGEDFVLGGGVGVRVNERVDILIDWESLNVDAFQLHTYSLGFKFHL